VQDLTVRDFLVERIQLKNFSMFAHE